MLTRSLDVRTAAYGADEARVADVWANLGLALDRAKRFDEALTAEERALAIRERVLGPKHPDVVSSLQDLAEVLLLMKRWSSALPVTERAIGIVEATRGTADRLLAPALTQRGGALTHLGRVREALPVLERALAVAESVENDPVDLAGTRQALALALRDSHGDMKRARTLAAQARATLADQPTANADEIREIDEAFPP